MPKNDNAKYSGIAGFCRKIKQLCGIQAQSLKKSDYDKIAKMLRHEYKNYWSSMIGCKYSKSKAQGGNKLRTYRTFKLKFCREPYLAIGNPKLRKHLTRFRVSAHRLNIETQRFNGRNVYIPPEGRLCTNCPLGVSEDESHFLIICPTYKEPRAALFQHFALHNPHFNDYLDSQKFLWIMSSENIEDAKQLAIFLEEAITLRQT